MFLIASLTLALTLAFLVCLFLDSASTQPTTDFKQFMSAVLTLTVPFTVLLVALHMLVKSW